MSAYGATGPWSPVPGIGGTIEPSSGMSALLGYVGGPPLNSGHMYPDPVAGLYGLGAVVTALAHRRRTGEGQYVDLSMQEACATFIGDEWMRYQDTGVPPARRGNRHPAYAPHGVFGCAGDDQWVALAAPDDAAWAAAARVLGGSELAERAASPRRRAAWPARATSRRRSARVRPGVTSASWPAALVAAGVIAAPVLDVGEVTGRFRPGRPGRAAHRHASARRGGRPGGPAAADGEHAAAAVGSQRRCTASTHWRCCRQELGLDEQTYAALAAAGITGCGPVKGN